MKPLSISIQEFAAKHPEAIRDANFTMDPVGPAAVTETSNTGEAIPAPECIPIQFYSPREIRSMEFSESDFLVGDGHIMRGGSFVIGGPPGCGKSRLTTGLSIAGATGGEWMGLPVRSRFKTLVVQAENGAWRLQGELSGGDPAGMLDDWLRISTPPDFGLAFTDLHFRDAVRRQIEEFSPGILIVDPWNRVAEDDGQRDYRRAWDAIQSVLPPGTDRPAVGIVAHVRKSNERRRGRDLLNEICGSLVLGSAARTVFILQPASADGQDDRVVFTIAKCNDGPEGAASAWHRRNGLFAPCEDFDWEAFYGEGVKAAGKVTEAALRNALEGAGWLRRKEAVKRIMSATGCRDSAAYDSLKKLAHLLEEDAATGEFHWKGER